MKKAPEFSAEPALYRKANIIQLVAAICMMILAVMCFTTPFMSVKADDIVPDEILAERKTSREVSFSLLDVINDLQAEYDLHMEHKEAMREIEEQESYEQSAVEAIKYNQDMPENGGNFSRAASTAILNAQYAYDARVAEMNEAVANGADPSDFDIVHHDLRIRFNLVSGNILITYCAIPLLLAVVLGIIAIVALLKSVIRAVKPGKNHGTAGAIMMVLVPAAPIVMSYVLADPDFGYSYSTAAMATVAVLWVVATVLDILGASLNKRVTKNAQA